MFLDTPGHEAFTAMRARGAKVTDIAIVVVAADDGVMPQTLEAIQHAKAAKVPIIIALNKIDKADSNPDRVKTELTEAGIVVEEYGGDTPMVAVSARTGQGLPELLDMINLVADLQELKANPKRDAVGTVIEAQMDKFRGPIATTVVQTGTLKVGDIVIVGNTWGKVKALENAAGKRAQKAGPGERGRPARPQRGAGGGRHPARRGRREGRSHRGRAAHRRPGRGERRGWPGDARGPLPADPGRPEQGAADRPQGRRLGLARGDHPRAAAAVTRTR